jgi:hypothetical protein
MIVLGVTTRAVDDRRRRGLHRSLGAANFDLAIGAAPSDNQPIAGGNRVAERSWAV